MNYYCNFSKRHSGPVGRNEFNIPDFIFLLVRKRLPACHALMQVNRTGRLRFCTQSNSRARNDGYKMVRNSVDFKACNNLVHISLIFLLSLFTLSSNATIHTVKQDGTGNFTTIQAGINAATTGDTVLVWPGTYFENIDYSGKSITVASLYLTTLDESYIHNTIIDGNMNGSCVVVSYCSEEFTTLCGFTLQHGSGNLIIVAGGGIFIEESTITIKNCIIKDCLSKSGGGIISLNSNVFMTGSVVKNNIALYKCGGIVIAYESNFTFDTINKNSVYLNYGPKGGCDISRTTSYEPQHIVLDTASVMIPDSHFFAATDDYGTPLNTITWEIENSKIEQVNSNLYVHPEGNNSNSGIYPDEPLQNLSYAIKKILPDTNNPKSIFLDEGTYAPLINNEIFPVTPRSYVSIIGEDAENTILDAEYVYPLLNSFQSTKSVSIENITFRRGTDSQAVNSGNGGFNIVGNDNIVFSNIVLEEVISEFYSGIHINFSNSTINNSKIIDNTGGYSLVLSNTKEELKHIIVANSIINNTGPTEIINEGFGGSVGISGTYSFLDATRATLINVLISENTLTKEPGTINFGVCGLSCSQHAKVTAINTTIGNNIVTNPVISAQVFAGEGASINFYNSIIYGTEDYEIFLGDGQPTSYIATVNVSYSNVKGGEENVQNWNNIHNFNWLEGNIDDDPLWIGGDPFNYELQPGSPGLNAGVPMYETGMDYPYIKEEDGKYILYKTDGDTITLPATDLAGNPRISGGRIDMGAYEWQDTTTGSSKFSHSDAFGRRSDLRVYPNPFKSNTFIKFVLEHAGFVQIDVLDLKGNIVKTITKNNYPRGNYKLVWDGKDDEGSKLEAGSYFILFLHNGRLLEYQNIIKAR